MLLPQTLPSTVTLPRRVAFRAARPLLSWICRLQEFEALYRRVQCGGEAPFYTRALRVLDITTDARALGDAQLPATGPLIVVANHPHGIVDGLVLAEIVGRARPDVRVLTNCLLESLPALADMCLFVDAFSASAPRTRAGLGAARRLLERGGALIVFPAGAVAHRDWQTSPTPGDGAWRDTVGRLALSSGAQVVPAYIAGRNRDVFYRAGRCHEALRTILLPRELLAMRGRHVTVALGEPLLFNRHRTGRAHGTAVTGLARAEVQRLGDRLPVRQASAVVAATDAAAMRSEVAALQDRKLVAGETFDVFCATADRMRALLGEIGRLREITFRSVGEGTSREIDLDRFDEHYLHLFAWDRRKEAVAGAYRLGPVDDIIAAHGIGGLYTSTLFRFDRRLLSGLGPAVELGRSFVRAEYQKSSNVLMLLWKGIAQFVVRSDRYRVLFGPVSISARYRDASRELLQAFLLQNARHRELAELVTALVPPAREMATGLACPADVQQLDKLIAGFELDGKGIPVLLRQYLRLNAKLLAFNVDAAFGDALDALMMVDLADVDRAILTRYFGRAGAVRVLDRRSLSHAA